MDSRHDAGSLMHLACVPPERVQEFWPLARRHVYAAVDRGRNLRTGRDVEYDVLTGQALLWLAVDGNQVLGAGVTQIHRDACWIIAWGADDQKRCAPLLATIEDYARAQGCAAVKLCGRLGWQRALRDYRPKAVIMEKELI